jgi:hypothetical protein
MCTCVDGLDLGARAVPPGQRLSTPTYEFDARSLQTERRRFEDEDDDEDGNEVLGAVNRERRTPNAKRYPSRSTC